MDANKKRGLCYSMSLGWSKSTKRGPVAAMAPLPYLLVQEELVEFLSNSVDAGCLDGSFKASLTQPVSAVPLKTLCLSAVAFP